MRPTQPPSTKSWPTSSEPLAVEHLPLRNFYPAEDYHQDYLEKNPAGYCHLPAALFELARKAKPVPSDH